MRVEFDKKIVFAFWYSKILGQFFFVNILLTPFSENDWTNINT